MKWMFILTSVASLNLFQIVEAKTIGWEGKSYHFGPGRGEVTTVFGGDVAPFDEDNPDPLTVLLESQADKDKRELRKALKQNLEQIFSILVPEHEQSKWYKKGPTANREVTEVEAKWSPKSDGLDQLSIVISANDLDGKKKYKNIDEFFAEYEKKLTTPGQYKQSVKVIDKNNDLIILEITRYTLGVSDLIKKDTEIKTLEKWILSDNWLISCSYRFPTDGNEEKVKIWDLLKDTWTKRFANLHFDSSDPVEKQVNEHVPG
jgi:hypothetical protein